MIDEEISKKLSRLICGKSENLGSKVIEFNSYLDHCHLLCSVPPQISLSDFVGQIKGYSAHEINNIFGEKYIQWQQGFGGLTLSSNGTPFIKSYIQNQNKHHGENNIIKILEYIPIAQP